MSTLPESTAELYAHAIAMEREAAERYAVLSRRMRNMGNDAAAALFARLATLESEHLSALYRRTAGVALPSLDVENFGIDSGASGTAYQALGMALRAEKRARAFFEQAQHSADPGMRALAREMAAEEGERIAMIEALLARTPECVVDWTAAFEPR